MFENMSDEEVMALAAKVGQAVAREYPGVDPEDIAQEAITGLLGKVDRIKQDDGSGSYYFVVMREIGRRYAAQERAYYQAQTAEFLYRPQDVRELLEAHLNGVDCDVPAGEDDLLNPDEGDTSIIGLMDLRRGLAALYERQRDVLASRFRDGDTEIHRQVVARAVEALTAIMNGQLAQGSFDHDGPGARHSMSNAEAQYMTRNQW